jgi:indole-3-glycerol phosphate synthase
MCAAGAQAVLVGEAFMAAPDPGAALRELLACP